MHNNSNLNFNKLIFINTVSCNSERNNCIYPLINKTHNQKYLVSYGIEFWGKVFDTHIKKLHTTLNSSEIIFNKPLPNYYFIHNTINLPYNH
ncbi:Reverse transcriptase domain-containing protein [Aphis craccivora]|uniref:Reverse transcriptase domain-containing protein n=1 Tax=Aphis craccivora TaxID=307492 RepID=A0A6G0YSZ7_APHCR|nr:Reverse transcriptase domain-containing protein [Aphis craccivora]